MPSSRRAKETSTGTKISACIVDQTECIWLIGITMFWCSIPTQNLNVEHGRGCDFWVVRTVDATYKDCHIHHRHPLLLPDRPSLQCKSANINNTNQLKSDWAESEAQSTSISYRRLDLTATARMVPSSRFHDYCNYCRWHARDLTVYKPPTGFCCCAYVYATLQINLRG